MSDSLYTFPASFDENVASLAVRGKTNDPSEKFSLCIASSFGQCQVRIGQGSDFIDALLSIFKANISIDYINSYPTRMSYENKSGDIWILKENKQIDRKFTSAVGGRVALETSVDLPVVGNGGKFGGGLKAEFATGSSNQDDYQQSVAADRTPSVVRVLSPNTIDISYPKHLNIPLDGIFLDEQSILDVAPIDASKNYGAVARLLVRESWITFSDITVTGGSRFARSLNSLIGWEAAPDRRKMFQRLLAHLVLEKLQDGQDSVNACLAIRGAFFDRKNDLTIHSSSRSTSSGLISLDSEILQKFIYGDDVDRKRILGAIKMDKHFSNEMQLNSVKKNDVYTPHAIAESTPIGSRVHSWFELRPVTGNKVDPSEWAAVFENCHPDFSYNKENSYLTYLYSLAKYPIIPEEHWVNICTYSKYNYDEFSVNDLFFRNGYRSMAAKNLDLLRLDSNRLINFENSEEKEDIIYNAGSWVVGGLGLTEQNFSKDEDSLYQYAVCLDISKNVSNQFDEEVVSDAIIAFSSDKRISEASKIVALVVVLEGRAFDENVFRALSEMDSGVAPSSQIGILNCIKQRNKSINISELRSKRQRDLLELTKYWIEKMSTFHEGMIYQTEAAAEYFEKGIRKAKDVKGSDEEV